MSKNLFKLTRVKALILMIILNLTFFFVELIIGNITHSNTLIADSFHMLNDLISFIIALASINISKKYTPNKNTFGWIRAEVLGSLINSVFLLALCFSIIIDSINRFYEPRELDLVDLILIVGSIGLVINLIGLILFACLGGHHLHSHKKNLNIRGVFLHVLADALGSVAIIISTLIVKYIPQVINFNWKLYIDPVLSLILAIFIIISTVPLLNESSKILLQTVPKHVDMNHLKNEIKLINGVLDIHDFYVWTLNSNCHIASLHLKVSNNNNNTQVYKLVKDLLNKNMIDSITIQIENESDSIHYDKCNKLKFLITENNNNNNNNSVHPIETQI